MVPIIPYLLASYALDTLRSGSDAIGVDRPSSSAFALDEIQRAGRHGQDLVDARGLEPSVVLLQVADLVPARLAADGPLGSTAGRSCPRSPRGRPLPRSTAAGCQGLPCPGRDCRRRHPSRQRRECWPARRSGTRRTAPRRRTPRRRSTSRRLRAAKRDAGGVPAAEPTGGAGRPVPAGPVAFAP